MFHVVKLFKWLFLLQRRENIQSLKSREEAALSEENYELGSSCHFFLLYLWSIIAEEFRLELEAIEVCEETVPVITNCHVLVRIQSVI